jgi:hypothetical protein
VDRCGGAVSACRAEDGSFIVIHVPPLALIVSVVHFAWTASDKEVQHCVSFSAEVCVSRWACLLRVRR